MVNTIQTAGIQQYNTSKELNFRLRLDIAGSDLRISDEINKPESGLDIDFDIIKTDNNIPNESTITIYNINNDTYANILQNATAFELYGAFAQDEFSLMFKGFPDKAIKKSKETLITSNKGFMAQRPGADISGQNDIPTILTLIDGYTNIEDNYLIKEYRNGVSTHVILNDCIESLGTPIGYIAQIEHKTLKGYTARGKTIITLNYLASILGFKWSIQNGVFTLTVKEKVQTYGILLHGYNSKTPERQDDKFRTKSKIIQKASKKKGIKGIKATSIEKTDNGFMIETMLLPFLNAGTFCDCDFDILQGVKYIYKVRHIGNNYGTENITKVFVV